jgi:mRNA-degrading endonuclease RelE of RelBE toxin-antitoxin system
MSYELRFSPQFRKDLQRLDSALHRRILDALGKLRDTPHQGRKLAGVGAGKSRIRIGDYRVRYDIERNVVLLYRVRKRGHLSASLTAEARGRVDPRAQNTQLLGGRLLRRRH